MLGSSPAKQVYRFVPRLSNRKIQLRAKLSYIAALAELTYVRRVPMLIRKPPELGYSQVAPKDVYLNRRRFLAGVGRRLTPQHLPPGPHRGRGPWWN